MSTYEHVLPDAFPVVLAAPFDLVVEAVQLLIWREDLLSGSSFAVTSRASGGGEDYRTLWLSDASARFLVMSGRAPDALREAVRTAFDAGRYE